MSKIDKRYWIWKGQFDHAHFFLGNKVSSLIERDLIESTPDENGRHPSKVDFIHSITERDGLIRTIAFQKDYLPLGPSNLINMELKVLEKEIDKHLIRLPDFSFQDENNSEREILYLVFRDFFVTLTMLVKVS